MMSLQNGRVVIRRALIRDVWRDAHVSAYLALNEQIIIALVLIEANYSYVTRRHALGSRTSLRWMNEG